MGTRENVILIPGSNARFFFFFFFLSLRKAQLWLVAYSG